MEINAYSDTYHAFVKKALSECDDDDSLYEELLYGVCRICTEKASCDGAPLNALEHELNHVRWIVHQLSESGNKLNATIGLRVNQWEFWRLPDSNGLLRLNRRLPENIDADDVNAGVESLIRAVRIYLALLYRLPGISRVMIEMFIATRVVCPRLGTTIVNALLNIAIAIACVFSVNRYFPQLVGENIGNVAVGAAEIFAFFFAFVTLSELPRSARNRRHVYAAAQAARLFERPHIVSVPELRKRIDRAEAAGVAWPPTLYTLLDDLDQHGIRAL